VTLIGIDRGTAGSEMRKFLKGLLKGLIGLGVLITCQLTQATVLTEPLDWRVPDVVLGLERLKAQYLDVSSELDAEFVGAVLRTPDCDYAFTQGQGPRGQKRVSFRVRRPADRDLVGFWHTHGAHGPAQSVFSPTDAKLVRKTGLPFYLIAPDGEIRVLKPEHLDRRSPDSRMMGAFDRLPNGGLPGVPVDRWLTARDGMGNCPV
jgi:hypothetical protein